MIEYTVPKRTNKSNKKPKVTLSIGDEVLVGTEEPYLTPKFIITHIRDDSVWLLNRSNGAFTIAFYKACHPTGKHFNQIEEILEKEEEDN